jgi:hypothetical protein
MKILITICLISIAIIFLGLTSNATTWEKPISEEVILEDEFKEEIDCSAFGDCSPEITRKMLVEEEISKQAEEYGVDPEVAFNIADCESDFNPYAQNPNSTAKGIYQFIDGTWDWIDASGHQYDYKENIRQFMIWFPIYPSWWSECL